MFRFSGDDTRFLELDALYLCSSHLRFYLHTVTRLTIDSMWIGNQICWTLTLVTTSYNYSVIELHTPKITVAAALIKSESSSELLGF
jgi:hypothetical protein